ncbi:MAG: NADH-quinone oxidoreductase subunit NuoE [Burkholderiales bacterium]|jgi:NADH-quinone oxidoreductase subunit E|nr:NADH-quinone oxidoreductase subunit NuoE [Betaproteobacteria bacterium]MDG1162736.1 NADH-quinone oxidoreductase subunit NuoE [Burkholderiales bacterium]MBT6185427.1 NADH-quinone oxidoreductase subunit NuoE [Betaproteobacteria bacterium]MBT7427032.1 NADH-quinone oxidoreductase subunit NuoE [Betaproteobacteria bacterium]MBT7997152.1 NADH-quinone oxidoreductase subunit NuoE [Betaproteobacteria bacterium]
MLSAEAYDAIDKEVAKYPPNRKQSAVMAALAIAQNELGWLSESAVEDVASYLEMRAIAVWEVATFYGMYNLKKPGRYKLSICTNLPCALQGANKTVDQLKALLGIDFNETDLDGLLTLKEAECMGACGDAPVVIINDREMRGKIGVEDVEKLLEELKAR